METSVGAIAGRYAGALFELADESKALDQVADDLRRVRAMLDDSADLRRLVRSPVINRADQGKAMAAVTDKAGISELTNNFIGLVAHNRRLFALAAMVDAYLAELARRRGEISAQVVSAAELSDGQVKAITDSLRKAVGSKVAVTLQQDPSLLGGLVVQVGSRMVDSSLKSKLQRLELAMKGIG